MAGCGTTAAYTARFSQVKVESFLPQAEQSRGGDERRTEGSASAEEADVEIESAYFNAGFYDAAEGSQLMSQEEIQTNRRPLRCFLRT